MNVVLSSLTEDITQNWVEVEADSIANTSKQALTSLPRYASLLQPLHEQRPLTWLILAVVQAQGHPAFIVSTTLASHRWLELNASKVLTGKAFPGFWWQLNRSLWLVLDVGYGFGRMGANITAQSHCWRRFHSDPNHAHYLPSIPICFFLLFCAVHQTLWTDTTSSLAEILACRSRRSWLGGQD